MRANLYLIVLFCGLWSTASAQNPNPFDLLWRIDGRVEISKDIPAAEVPPAPKPTPPAGITPEAAIDTYVVATNPPPVPPETEDITPEETPEEVIAPDTAANAIDTTTVPDTSSLATEIENITPPDAITPEKEAEITPEITKPVDIPEETTPLVLVIIFGVLFSLLAWVLSLNRDILRKVYRAALNENFSALLFREQRFATTQYLYYIIYIVFFITGGMFLYLIGREFGWTAWVFRSIWTSIGLVAVVYLLRHLTLSILGSTYPITKETTHFSFSIVLHNILLGIALIPVTLFLAFGPDSLDKGIAIAGVILCGLVYLMRQFRGLVIGGSYLGAYPLHFFVYLCAVEILPLITLVKFFHH